MYEKGGGNMWVVSLMVAVVGVAQGMVRLDPLVDTPAGLIRGLRADDGDYAMFLGVPYAQVQEENPFGASIPHPKFETAFDAFDDSVVCPQVEEFGDTIVGSLDCLRLNIFVPNKASSKTRLPVLVWIHGGGFNLGSGNRHWYGPKYLVRHDVILVTMNYRLGLYGFLCLDTPEVPGNQGLKDQLQALRWIKNNIASFGGDVNRITLMGESAGGVSIEYHLMSEQDKLFNNVILQSGSVFIPRILVDANIDIPFKLAEHLGLVTEDLSEALQFLAKTDVSLVMAAMSELGLFTMPCVEKEFENVENIFTDHPINLNTPKAKNTPILSGFNNKEMMDAYANMPDDDFKKLNVFESSLQFTFNYDDEFKEMEAIVRRFYIGDEEKSAVLRWNLVDFGSDFTFNFPIQMSLKNFFEAGAQNVYYYMFSYSGGRNFAKMRHNITAEGATHMDELGYLFDMSDLKDTPSEEDQLMIDRITTLWTNFVKYSDPTPEVTELLPVKWTPVTEDTYTYLDIGSELVISRRPFNDRMAFWELFFDVNKSKVKGYRQPETRVIEIS